MQDIVFAQKLTKFGLFAKFLVMMVFVNTTTDLQTKLSDE